MADNNGIFSAKAKAVLQAARMAARNLGSDCVSTEHLLLGLVREDSGFAVETLKAIVRRCDSADSSSVRDTFGLLMLVRASNGTPDTLTDRLLQEIPEEDRKAAQEEWIPAALGRDGHEKSYEQILSAADAEAEPNLDIIIKIYGPQQIDTLVADLVEGVPTLRPHIEEPTMQTPIDASTGVGGDGPSMPAPASTPIPTPTPEPVPPTPPYQSQLP